MPKPPPWSKFNVLGRSSAVRSSYIWVVVVPIFAKMLSEIPQDFNLPIVGTKGHLVLGVAISGSEQWAIAHVNGSIHLPRPGFRIGESLKTLADAWSVFASNLNLKGSTTLFDGSHLCIPCVSHSGKTRAIEGKLQ